MSSWYDTIAHLKGIGPAKVALFQKLGVETIQDLLFHFPFRFDDIKVRPLQSIMDQEKVTLKGQVVSEPIVTYFGPKKSRLGFRLGLEDGQVIGVAFFNQPFLKNNLSLGKTVLVHGKWQSNKQTLLGMKILKMSQEDQTMAAVYPATQGLKQAAISQAVTAAFDQYGSKIPNLLPQYLRTRYRLLDLEHALRALHFPLDARHYHEGKRTIIYTEFFLYHYVLSSRLALPKRFSDLAIHYDLGKIRPLIDSLPFIPTPAQKQAVNEIFADLSKEIPMRRMLQGDVGSGKTLVAFLAILATVTAGYQAALMVPTEILAKQHTLAFNRYFEAQGYKAYSLVSNIKANEKGNLINALITGEVNIVIGTHALIQDNVAFKNLGLVVIDEQHRFGVGQRQALADKEQKGVNLLQMTATPIPRSLALTLYGDLQVSSLDQGPAGRQPIQTFYIKGSDLTDVYQRIQIELSKGHQVYYVLPMIDVSEAVLDVDNVLEIAEDLRQTFPHVTIDTLHGLLAKDQQVAVMDAFKANEVQILVATTMVEVGVDVPNATVMVIQSAERFGLAQLHQLRGRVGRSDLPSYCYLIGNPTTEQGQRRLEIMTQSQDGFYLSQEDLKIRGAGDLLGKDQSGLPRFHFANIIEDQHILTIASQDAKALLQDPSHMTSEEKTQLDQWVSHHTIEL
ncbi:TPA: ATP-dependent DNA helicase RecG [Streptococcus suis]